MGGDESRTTQRHSAIPVEAPGLRSTHARVSAEAVGSVRTRDVPGADPDSKNPRPAAQLGRTRSEITRLLACYDRAALYDQLWSGPALEVAKAYGISGVRLGKGCRQLQVPVPLRGYWARVRSGQKLRRPPFPRLK
jgi:hypothetical protein